MRQARLQMRMRAKHQRPIVEGVDAYNQPLPEKLTTVDSALPCFAWYQSERGERQNNESYAAIGTIRMIVPAGTDLDEGDVFDAVKDKRGNVLFDGPLRVVSIARRPDHVAVACREVTGGRP